MQDVLMERIKHIVVLMLENRSFDSMLGRLYAPTGAFDGLTLQETNPDPAGGPPITVWNKDSGSVPVSMTIPDPDPGELFVDINTQIFGKADPAPNDRPTMQGFTQNYTHQTKPPDGVCVARDIMHYYGAEQLPVMHALARQFAVCDRWFASAPCQTWPNRFFAHTATAGGFENNSPPHFPYEMKTVFNLMSEKHPAEAWKIYYHDFPQSLALSRLWPHLDRFRFFDEFLANAKAGTLPSYSFIEPRYFADLSMANDQHPPHVVTMGEQLMADVYNALRAGPQWTETLLIITYDEHGGLFDHVPPPSAVPPSPPVAGQRFSFDRYGVRVPALLISPYIRQGTVLRPPAGPPFDHASIISTLRRRFSLGPPLTLRDEVAPDISGVFSADTPDNLGPSQIERPVFVPEPKEVVAARDKPANDMQRALMELAAHLPNSPPVKPPNVAAFITSHIEQLKITSPALPPPQSVAEASHFVKQELDDFLRIL